MHNNKITHCWQITAPHIGAQFTELLVDKWLWTAVGMHSNSQSFTRFMQASVSTSVLKFMQACRPANNNAQRLQ